MQFSTKDSHKYAMFQDILQKGYHPELMEAMVDASNRSQSANVAANIVFLSLSYEYMPFNLWVFWLVIQIVMISLRLNAKTRLLKVIDNEMFRDKVLQQNIVIISAGGYVWGVATIMATLYLPVTHQLFTLLLVVGLSAGSIATLSPVYRAFALFIIPMLSVQVITTLFTLDQIHLFMAFIVLIFMFIVLSSAHSVYERMKEAIELRDKIKTSEEELLELNSTLEERIQEESEKNAQKTRLLYHQSRHAQMGEMLGMIAHQWRQPLTSISASTTAIEVDMLMDNWDKSLFKDHIGRIAMLSQHLSSTIDDFRSFFKENKLYEKVGVSEIIASSLQIIEASMKTKNININIDEASDTKVSVIRNEMRQVLLNLLKNSEDALLEFAVENPNIWINSYEDETSVYVSIEDNAGGIDAKIIDKVFEPYFTTKMSLNGTGLGLYMSHMIIQDHFGAEITVVNGTKGAKFTIRLPKEVQQNEQEND